MVETADADDSTTMSQAPSTPLAEPFRETIAVSGMAMPPIEADLLAAAVTPLFADTAASKAAKPSPTALLTSSLLVDMMTTMIS